MVHRYPWLRRLLEKHTAYIPKGFLRFYVLKLLRDKPMSGSEIMDEIERRTEGNWRPSPGSIYPLLAWLRDKNLVKELSSDEGVKRYMITEDGRKLLDVEREFFGFEKMGKNRFFTFMIPFWLLIYSTKIAGIRVYLRELFRQLFIFKGNIELNHSEEALQELKGALEQFVNKVKEINDKFGDGENENKDQKS